MNDDPNEIHFECPKCKRHLRGERALLVKKINCPDCNESFFPTPRKPEPEPASKPALDPARPKLHLECPACHFDFGINVKALANEFVTCPNCGAAIPLATRFAEAAATPAPPEPEAQTIIATTGNDLSGRVIEKHIGIARGVAVRSPDMIHRVLGAQKQIVAANSEACARVCEETRRLAFARMIQHAGEMKADAIIAVRYDATELAPGTTEVLAYGTAVKLRPAQG